MAQNKLRIKGVNTGGGGNLTDFISVWDTTLGDGNPSIILPLVASGNYNFSVNWGDGNTDTITAYDQAEVTHTYATGGIYTVTITGTIEGCSFNGVGSCPKLTSITNIGPLKLGNEGLYFYGCSNLTTIGGIFDLTGTTNLGGMFSGCNSLTSVNGISSWDVSSVTNMNGMFNQATAFNQDISGWDVSNVTDMGSMFGNATAFNQDISGWKTSVVTNMGGMFIDAISFNQDISGWDTSAVTDMQSMFAGTSAFNQPLNSWDVSNVIDMGGMFGVTKDNVSIFNQPLNLWDTSAVTNMVGMFSGNQYFNQDIGAWNTAAVTDMTNMFGGAEAFNQDISGWNVSAVTDMSAMFNNATVFNQPLNSWDVSSVTNMGEMFSYATAFNQNISSWDVSSVIEMGNMFNGTPFNQDISGWDVSSVTNMSYMFQDATTFNQDISGWNTSAVTDMNSMFNQAMSFNQDISGWDVSSVTDMSNMFRGDDPGDTAFNQDISGWDVSSVTNMSGMFYNATFFTQDISGWDISNVTGLGTFMEGKTTADYSYYDDLLNAWSALTLQNGVEWGMGTIEYTAAGATARQDIIDNYSWTITDGGELIPTLSYNVSYGFPGTTLTQTQINNITGQSPTLTLTRYTGPGFIMSNTSISSIGNLTQVSGNLFTSTFNQSDLLDILVDGAYYGIGGSDNYSPGGFATQPPYYDGSSGSYFIKWNESAGKFYSAGSLNQYNPITGGGQIFDDYEPGDALYNEIDPLTDTLEFLAGLPK